MLILHEHSGPHSVSDLWLQVKELPVFLCLQVTWLLSFTRPVDFIFICAWSSITLLFSANSYNDYFLSQYIRKTFNLFSGTPLCGFERVTNETVLKFMKQMSPKTCVLDPILMSLLFECSNKIVPLLTANVNQSLSTCMKAAIVKSLLKKTSLDPKVLKNNNFRPVSNLSTVSKLIEKVVLNKLLCHLDQNNLWHTVQSAYRPKHSTKTAEFLMTYWPLQTLALSPFWCFFCCLQHYRS